MRVELAVSGARVGATVGGAQLVLEYPGRKIAYSRLRAVDATAREMLARMVAAMNYSTRALAR